MTQVEEMAQKYRDKFRHIRYMGWENPTIQEEAVNLIRQVAERTREEACLGLEKYLDIKLYPTESMKLQKAIHKARWEDEEDKP